MRAGKIVVEGHNSAVRAALLTPQTRSWYGPLFEGRVEQPTENLAVLSGRFRFTYPEIVSVFMFEIGFVLCTVQALFSGEYRKLGLDAPETVLAGLGLATVMAFLCRYSWHLRGWKKTAVLAYLTSCGFTEVASSEPANEETVQQAGWS